MSVVGILPHAYKNLNIEKNKIQTIQVMKVLEYLNKNMKGNMVFARRIAIISTEWVRLKDKKLMNSKIFVYL